MDKKSVAKILKEIGIILDLKGDNPFKTRAYHNGARIIESLTENLQDLVTSGEIANLKGIGKALSDKITTLVQTGNLPYYEELKSTIPEGLLDLIKIPGLGAKKVKIVYEKLDRSDQQTLASLESPNHCRADARIRSDQSPNKVTGVRSVLLLFSTPAPIFPSSLHATRCAHRCPSHPTCSETDW